MWAAMVVFVIKHVEQRLEIGDRCWLVKLGSKPFFEGLLETFDLAARGWMMWPAVLLNDSHWD
jgi:hypothetical protein